MRTFGQSLTGRSRIGPMGQGCQKGVGMSMGGGRVETCYNGSEGFAFFDSDPGFCEI